MPVFPQIFLKTIGLLRMCTVGRQNLKKNFFLYNHKVLQSYGMVLSLSVGKQNGFHAIIFFDTYTKCM